MFLKRNLILPVLILGLVTSSVQALDKEAVNAAIESGVQYLRTVQGRDGSWSYNLGGMAPGATALAGLTLVECGAKSDDRQVLAAADYVRVQAPTTCKTYSMSAMIMFLDRLGDPGDVPLIESLTVRLLAGQSGDGGWGYDCPPISDEEVTRLQNSVKNRAELKGGRELPKPGKRTVKDLPPQIQGQLQSLQRMGGPGQGMPGGFRIMADNSNTQFATLALWIARRHGLPVENAIARVDSRFRRSQSRDGSWGYMWMGVVPGSRFTEPMPSAAMTCSGILGLAVAHGVNHDPDVRRAKEAFDPAKDLALAKALLALGTAIGKPGGEATKISEQAGNGKAYYFLWSLERVAMALNLETIGEKDWYGWGAEVLLANQQRDGSWLGEYSGNVQSQADTCFALLFLRRSNLVKDISSNLKGRLADPGLERTLKSGGVGSPGMSNAGKDLKPALGKEGKSVDPRPKGPAKLEPIPTKAAESKEDRLAKKLLEAKGPEFKTILEELQKSNGAEYTGALAIAIPRLQGESRDEARDALGERLMRKTGMTLAGYITDRDPEIRRAAIIASASKKPPVRENIPLIIDRLNDGEPSVVHVAAMMLKIMTKEDFGPATGATREEHEKAIKDWTAWWKKQAEK